MGITAENIAEQFNITREEQDNFALSSQQKAGSAIENSKFVNEITPITIKTRREEIIFDTDEYVRPETTLDSLAKLRPAVKKDGTVTAGNASGINDGAALIFSTPPQTTMLLSPSRIACVPKITLFNPDPQTLLTVNALFSFGISALTAIWRAIFCPSPA